MQLNTAILLEGFQLSVGKESNTFCAFDLFIHHSGILDSTRADLCTGNRG